MEFSSKLLEKAVNEMAQLPGIGKRTALRLVLHLLKQPKEQTQFLTESLQTMRNDVKYCKSCLNISDVELCEICSNEKRNHQIIDSIPANHSRSSKWLFSGNRCELHL